MILTTNFRKTIEKKRCCVVVFQPSVEFHIETAIWFALQIIPGFYMKFYTQLKWVKRKCSLPQILSLVCQTGAKIQAKIPSHSGDCVLGDDQLDALPLMTKGLGILSIA